MVDEKIMIPMTEGSRLGIGLICVRDSVKVAGLSEQGIAKRYLSIGDTILSIDGIRIVSEKEGYERLLQATSEIHLSLRRYDKNKDAAGIESARVRMP